ncbi:MAG: putative transcriptional regulator [Nocardioides sp.]|nr:putative transcriptional regulator [Nocardioides sp.]
MPQQRTSYVQRVQHFAKELFANNSLQSGVGLMPSSVTPDIAGLRALSHPVRLRMLGLLRTEGAATATTLAQRLDLNTGATSYHLCQLAQHGFITEDTDRGNARDRWWRATHDSTRADFQEQQQDDEDVEAYLSTVALVYGDRLRAGAAEMRFLPDEWRTVGTLSDWERSLTPADAEALVEKLTAIIEQTPDSEDEGAAPFSVKLNAFPRPGALGTGE